MQVYKVVVCHVETYDVFVEADDEGEAMDIALGHYPEAPVQSRDAQVDDVVPLSDAEAELVRDVTFSV